MAEHFRGSGHILRFIEYMDVGTTNGWRMDDVVPAAEIVATIDASWPLEPLAPNYPGEVANRYRYRDGAGEIGVIASVTQPFCGDCTRARLSADGRCTPACSPPPATTCARCCAAARPTRARQRHRRDLAHARRPLLGAAHRRRHRASPKVEMSYIGG